PGSTAPGGGRALAGATDNAAAGTVRVCLLSPTSTRRCSVAWACAPAGVLQATPLICCGLVMIWSGSTKVISSVPGHGGGGPIDPMQLVRVAVTLNGSRRNPLICSGLSIELWPVFVLMEMLSVNAGSTIVLMKMVAPRLASRVVTRFESVRKVGAGNVATTCA